VPLTSVIVKLRESALKDQKVQFAGWKVRAVVKLEMVAQKST